MNPIKVDPVDENFIKEVIRETLDLPLPPKQKTNHYLQVINIVNACIEYKEVRMGYYWETIIQWINALSSNLSKDEYASRLAKTVVLFTESLRATDGYISFDMWQKHWIDKKPEYFEINIK